MLVDDVMLIDPEDVPGHKDRKQVSSRYRKRAELLELQRDRGFRKTLKLVGFDTRGLEPDRFWKGQNRKQERDGIQIAIVRSEQATKARKRSRRSSRRRRKELLVAVPAERLRREKLSEEQFRQMLSQRGFDDKSFVQLVLEQSRKRTDDAEVWVIRILEQAALPPPEQDPEQEPAPDPTETEPVDEAVPEDDQEEETGNTTD